MTDWRGATMLLPHAGEAGWGRDFSAVLEMTDWANHEISRLRSK
jgi:hypothetical protein